MLVLNNATKVQGNTVSGLNLDKRSHEMIEEGIRLLKEYGQEIPNVKLNKKGLFEYGAELLLNEIKSTLGIVEEVDSSI